jgi:acetolactate synthase small subunit
MCNTGSSLQEIQSLSLFSTTAFNISSINTGAVQREIECRITGHLHNVRFPL